MGASSRQQARDRAAADPAEAVRRTSRRRLVAVLVAVVVAVLAAGVASAVLLSRAAGAASAVAGRTSAPPWAAPADVETRAKAAGLPMLTAEGQALHIHEHLTVTVDGRSAGVPALLGLDEAAQRIAAIHTHDRTGIIHVEAPEVTTFRLGQAFTEWDVALGRGRIGGYEDGKGGDRVALFVNGKAYTGDPAALALGERQDIDFVVTTDGSAPKAPATPFAFPAGY